MVFCDLIVLNMVILHQIKTDGVQRSKGEVSKLMTKLQALKVLRKVSDSETCVFCCEQKKRSASSTSIINRWPISKVKKCVPQLLPSSPELNR